MDLSGVIESFLTGTYAVVRQVASTYDSYGRLLPATTSTLQVRACFQPASGRDLQRLPEGFRSSEVLAGWVTSTMQMQDVVTVDGEAYEVQHIERWGQLGNYTKVLALKVGD